MNTLNYNFVFNAHIIFNAFNINILVSRETGCLFLLIVSRET